MLQLGRCINPQGRPSNTAATTTLANANLRQGPPTANPAPTATPHAMPVMRMELQRRRRGHNPPGCRLRQEMDEPAAERELQARAWQLTLVCSAIVEPLVVVRNRVEHQGHHADAGLDIWAQVSMDKGDKPTASIDLRSD